MAGEKWDGVIVNDGNDLLNSWVAGKTLTFDHAAAGTGYVSDIPLMAQTALVNQKQTVSILGAEKVPEGYRLKLQVTPIDTGYTLNQFGIWASVTGGSVTMLALYQHKGGVPIPSKSETPDFAYTFYALVMCSNTGEWTVNIDSGALVTQGDMAAAIGAAVATKQDKITAVGILKGNGNGNVTAAIPGTDYGYPVATGTGVPTKQTQGATGQHYIDDATGKEYVCKGHDATGYLWGLAGATDAVDLTYNGGNLATALEALEDSISDLEQAADDGKTLTGNTDPTTSTAGAVGQMYVNTQTGSMFICTGKSGDNYVWTATGGGAAVLPQIVVTVDTGSAVTCTSGSTTLTATAENNKAVFDVPDYGTWTIQATLGGLSSSVATVDVDSVKQYTATLSYFSATLTVTAEVGASVEATDGTHIYTGTCGSNGKCALTLRYSGTYTVKARLNNCNSSTTTASVTTSGGSYTATVKFITLTVSIDTGSSVSASNGSTTLTGTSANGSVKFYLPNTGTWNVTATLNGETASGSVACGSYTGFTLELSYVKVFGVMWNYANQSTALSRLTKTNDPQSVVNVNISGVPSPAVGTGAGSSPFDSYAPWNGMEEYNISGSTVGAKRGASGFTRTGADTMVYIPEFYFKIVDDAANSKRYFYVADKAKAGFAKHPGSGKYVGRYNTISGNFSKSGAAPLVNITRATARSGAKGKGAKWSEYDFASWCAVWLLYLVEFADWDSQSKIGRGYCDGNSSAISSGGTDSMTYHTGRAAGTDGKTAVQYRHIENPWGNVFEWIDGVNFDGGTVYVCTNPANYADDTASNYTNAGTKVQSNGYIKSLGFSAAAPWSFFPTNTGGSETTYIADCASYNSGWRVLRVGGYWSGGSGAGLFCFYANYVSSSSYSYVGARLLFHP